MRVLLGILLALLFVRAADAKSLVVVFSRADENYQVGNISEGNTMKLAKVIAEKTGSDLFEIKPYEKYPADYKKCTEVAQEELRINARPAILEDKSPEEYDTIFLGYPIWWGEMPMCVYTYLERHDFNGKKIYPFATHEGSGMGRTESSLKLALPGAEIHRGIAVRGSEAQNLTSRTVKSLESWLKSAGFLD